MRVILGHAGPSYAYRVLVSSKLLDFLFFPSDTYLETDVYELLNYQQFWMKGSRLTGHDITTWLFSVLLITQFNNLKSSSLSRLTLIQNCHQIMHLGQKQGELFLIKNLDYIIALLVSCSESVHPGSASMYELFTCKFFT